MFIAYLKRSNIHKTVHSVKRKMPADSQVLVRIGDEVKPEKIVGLGRKSAGFRRINASEDLGVKPHELKQYIKRMEGSFVNKGDVLAEKKGLFGIRSLKVESPIKGVVYTIDETSGVITMNYEPEEVKIVSGVRGKVTAIDPDEYSVTITTDVIELTGKIGIGNRREGSVHLMGQPDLPISEKQIDPTWENKIIVGGSLITKKVLYHCIALKVQGIVTGGMHWEDYAALVGSRGRFEDIGISLVLTEGFGNMPLSPKLFDFFHQFEGKFSFIEGSGGKLVIPDISGSPRDKAESQRMYSTLEKGKLVRLLTLAYRGESGTIKELREAVLLDNGITSDTAIVALRDGDEIEIPVTSLEILEE